MADSLLLVRLLRDLRDREPDILHLGWAEANVILGTYLRAQQSQSPSLTFLSVGFLFFYCVFTFVRIVAILTVCHFVRVSNTDPLRA